MHEASDDVAVIARLREARDRVKQEMGKVVVGQHEIIDSLLIGLLCRGHVLLHGVPGLGKTLMARTLSRTLDMEFRRVQFTPDLMPADITGTDVMEEDQATGKHRVSFLPGPVFTNFLLADEINRTPPKTQAALLASDAGRRSLRRPRDVSRSSRRSSSWPRRTRSKWKAPIRCPKRSSTASCSMSR